MAKGWSRQDQGGNDGGRSQECFGMDGEPAGGPPEPSQDEGRSHGGNLGRGSRGVSSCDDAGMDGEPDGAKQTQSLDDPEDPEG